MHLPDPQTLALPPPSLAQNLGTATAEPVTPLYGFAVSSIFPDHKFILEGGDYVLSDDKLTRPGSNLLQNCWRVIEIFWKGENIMDQDEEA